MSTRTDDAADVGDRDGSGEGSVVVSGYFFKMYLPGRSGRWVGERADGGRTPGTVDERLADRQWLCYAWPAEYGRSGLRAYVLVSPGDILACRNTPDPYSGDHAPAPGFAGFVDDGPALSRSVAANLLAADGKRWIICP